MGGTVAGEAPGKSLADLPRSISRLQTVANVTQLAALREYGGLRMHIGEDEASSLRRHARFPLTLAAVLAAICVLTLWAPPAGRTSWALEVGPGLIEVALLLLSYRRLPLSHLVYGTVFVHVLVLIYGGYYTYALTPLGNWAQQALGLSRNHYDRVGHLALGVFPVLLTRELLLRTSPLERGKWLFFISVSIVFAFAAFWELLEWWVTLLVASDLGQAFLGSQGDVWDAQWDMLLALVGAVLSWLIASGLHDRSMAKVPIRSREPARDNAPY